MLTDYWGSRRSMVGLSTDADALIYGGVNGYRSDDGGDTFSMINHWGEYYSSPNTKLHADLRGIDAQRLDVNGVPTDHVLFHTDGGTFVSTDAGQTVSNLSVEGLGIAQFYSTLSDALDPDRIAGGTQDQGFQLGLRGAEF